MSPQRHPSGDTTPRRDLSRADDFDETWVYLSGGGMAAALVALGSMFFLYDGVWAGDQVTHPGDSWRKVTRVLAVSGGSLENAALVEAGDETSAHFVNSFKRFVTLGRPWHYPITIVNLVAFLGLAIWPFSSGWPSNWGWVGQAIVLVMAAALAHLGVRSYGRERIRWHIGHSRPNSQPNPEANRTPMANRVHIFSTVDINTSLPLYLMTWRDLGRANPSPEISQSGSATPWRWMAAHDRTSQANRFELYTIDQAEVLDAAYASSAWPALTVPRKLIGHPLARDQSDSDWGPLNLGVQTAQPTEDGSGHFVLLDGGLASTLGSRADTLEPSDPNRPRPTLMGLLTTNKSERVEGAVSPAVRRVVVDAGSHQRSMFLPGARLPLLGAVIGVWGAIKASLNSQITYDRLVANVGRPGVWYLPATGHGRHFQVRLRVNNSLIDLNVTHPAHHQGAQGATKMEVSSSGHDSVPILSARDRAAIEFLDILRFHADRVKLFTGKRRHGLGCAASGVANGFAEAQGIGDATFAELEQLLRRFERAVGRTGELDRVFTHAIAKSNGRLGSMFGTLDSYRWPELEALHHPNASTPHHDGDSAAKANWFGISHQGSVDRDSGAHPNTTDSFRRAYEMGVRVMECDVQLTADGKLIGLHSAHGWVRPGRLPRLARRMTKEAIDKALGYETSLIDELIESLHDADSPVTWNFEAKGARSMQLLLRIIDQWAAPDRGTHPDRPPRCIVSGGWSPRRLKTARTHDSFLVTAGTWPEKLRLLFGRPVYQVAVIQLPSRLSFFTGRIARNAAKQRIQVQWFGVHSSRRLDRVRSLVDRAGVISDSPDVLKILGDATQDQ